MTTNLLVTGANGDIGRAVVKQALSQGKRVFATVRNKDHCSSFESHQRLRFLIMHVDDPESVRNAFATVDQELGSAQLNAVIHCAAIQTPACVEFIDPEHLEQTLRVNTLGSMLVMQEAFPRLRASHGNLILASSIWGIVAGPAVCPYAASKWALQALANSARCETRGMGFKITTAHIGAVKSRMLNAHIDEAEQIINDMPEADRSLYAGCLHSHTVMSMRFVALAIGAEKVAARLLQIADTDKPRRRYTIGTDAHFLQFIDRWLPSALLDKVLSG